MKSAKEFKVVECQGTPYEIGGSLSGMSYRVLISLSQEISKG